MTARFAPVTVQADSSSLSSGDSAALSLLIDAARLLNPLFMDQLWSGNRTLYRRLQQETKPLGQARFDYLWFNKGPWSDLDGHTAIIPDLPARKPHRSQLLPR